MACSKSHAFYNISGAAYKCTYILIDEVLELISIKFCVNQVTALV